MSALVATPGMLVRHKPWFRGVYKGSVGRVRAINERGAVEVDFEGDPLPQARVYETYELVEVRQSWVDEGSPYRRSLARLDALLPPRRPWLARVIDRLRGRRP